MLKNGAYNTAAGLIRIGIGILTIPVLIRSLGVEEYGLWTLASTVISVVALAEAGLATATTIFISQDLAKDDFDGVSETLTVTVGAMLILAVIVVIFLWMGAEPIVGSFSKLAQTQHLIVVQAIQIGGLVVSARLLQQILVGVEQAYQCYDLMNLLNTIQSLLNGLGMLLIVGVGGHTVELMEWQVFTSISILLAHMMLVFSLTKLIKLRPCWNKHKGLTIVRYSGQTWLASLGGVLFSQVDRLIVGSMLGSKELGIYAAITNITSQINVLSALPVQPLVPYLARHDLDRTTLQKRIKSALQLNAVVALGLGAILYSFAPLILNILLDKTFSADLIVPFRIATAIYALYSVNAVGYYTLFAIGEVSICMKIQLLSGVFSLLLIYLGVSNFGVIGAVTGNIGYLGVWFLTIAAMNRIKIDLNLWSKWIGFPIMWFIIILISGILVGRNSFASILIFVIQSAILVHWYSKNSSFTVKHIIT